MSTSDPIAPDRLEALLRGEAGADGGERRIGALLDELTVGRDRAARGAARARALAHDRTGRGPPLGAAGGLRRLRPRAAPRARARRSPRSRP